MRTCLLPGLSLALWLVCPVVWAKPLPELPKKPASQAPQAPTPRSNAPKNAPKQRTRGWHLSLEGALNLPLDAGGRVVLELPGRFRVATSLGAMPASFVGLINSAMVGAGVYSAGVAEVIQEALGGSVSWRLHGEWRPFASAGFYLGGGYGMLHIRSQTAASTIADIAALSMPASLRQSVSFGLDATLHMLNAEIGWEWVKEVISFRLAVGFMATIHSHTQIRVEGAPAAAKASIEETAQGVAGVLDQVFRSYVFSPYLSLSMGVRIF